jgi:hypothetical protein
MLESFSCESGLTLQIKISAFFGFMAIILLSSPAQEYDLWGYCANLALISIVFLAFSMALFFDSCGFSR